MAKLLTKRKQKWVDVRKTPILRGQTINPSASIALRYYAELERMIDQMVTETEKSIKRLFNSETAEEYFAMDDSISAQARILTNELIKKFTSSFAKQSKPIAEKFTKASDKAANSAVYSGIKDLSGGLSISVSALEGQLTDMLSATVTENVALIKSIPAQFFTQVQGQVMRSITTGNGLQDLIPFLEKQKGITRRRAKVIAMDQTRKAMNGLSRAKMQNLGLRQFQWLHSGGSNEPRPLHVKLSGQVFSFDDPPVIDEKTGQRGFPSDLINCRCKLKMVLSFDDQK